MSKNNFKYHDFNSLMLCDWRKAVNGDLTVLRIEGGNDEHDLIAWHKIQEQYSEEFATERKHIYYNNLLKRLTILRLNLVITEDRSIENDIDVVEEEMEKAFPKANTSNSTTLTETLVFLTKKLGVLVTEQTITAKFFFTSLKLFANGKEGSK